jgi:tRNA pseudouridine38-40 synthase
MIRNIKLLIEYDGTDFVGWQRQMNGRSVQQEIESALQKLTSETVTLVGAGRTDSGVHARGQVANFFTRSNLSINDFHRGLNGILPDDVVIYSVDEADKDFSARYSAKERKYCYYISQHPTAIERKYSWQLGYDFNIALMNEAALNILGTHEFQSFCKSVSEVDNFLCTVYEARWEKINTKLIFTIRANRFLHGMVRALVGTLINVGRGYTPYNEFVRILSAKDRTKAGQSAPPQGLFLEHVQY